MLELQAKNQTIIKVPLFSIFQQSPPLPAGFVCTLTVQKVSGNDPPLVLSSEPFPTKKAAEQDVARKMLLNFSFVQLLPGISKPVSAPGTLPAGPPNADLDEGSSTQSIPAHILKRDCQDPLSTIPIEEIDAGVNPNSKIIDSEGPCEKADSNAQVAQVRIFLLFSDEFYIIFHIGSQILRRTSTQRESLWNSP